MSIFNPSFLLGLIFLLWLSSFVVFAIIRIATGISIQRLGYFSLRRITYTPRDGIRIETRALGLHFHRPTFAQPTWISLRLTELKVTVDARALGAGAKGTNGHHEGDSASTAGKTRRSQSASSDPPKPILRHVSPRSGRSQAWKRLTQLKERIKRLHEKIHLLRLVDVSAMNSSLVIQDVGYFQVGTFSMVVDTRRKTVDRGRLFQHKKIPAGDQRPAEWIFTVKGVLFTPEGKESLEVVDICTLNIHGLLYKDRAGLRDTSIALKLGRIHLPYDDFVACSKRFEQYHGSSGVQEQGIQDVDISFNDVMDELDRPGSREAKIVQTVSDSKEFVSSILRGIQEIQMAVSFVGMTKEIRSVQTSGSPLYLNIAMNEFGIDMHRLDSKSPEHRMYFPSKDIAHQALLAAISIAVSLDDGQGDRKRILYVPMATTTMKTTLPSKTVAFSEDKNAAERNANILFANLVVTSPSIDVSPDHLPLGLAIINSRSGKPAKNPTTPSRPHHLLSRLLPKANIKLSVHEPVIRVVLPPADVKLKGTDQYDLLILSISSVSLDVESSHSTTGDLHYSLTSNLRIASNELYYHTASAERHNLLITEALELKVELNASPEVRVSATGNLQTFSIHMVRAEITAGVRQIVQQLSKAHRHDGTVGTHRARNLDFLRPLPPWLIYFSLRGSNFGVEVAGVDGDVSNDTRGIALQLESWTAEYKIKRNVPDERAPSRRHGVNKSSFPDEPVIKVTPPPGTDAVTSISTDGRRLAVHVRGLEGFVVEGIDSVEPEAFLNLPRFEVAFATSSDKQGPIFHIHSHTKAFYAQYSLYRYYAIGVATTVLKNAFASDRKPPTERSAEVSGSDLPGPLENPRGGPFKQLITIDVKADKLQIKAKMPADPPMMLQIYRMEAGRHRWANPFMKSHLVRLYAEAPQISFAWARIVSIKAPRIDLREKHRKRGHTVSQEKSIDVVTDFIRIGVPHQMVMHKIMDNFVNAMKATEQMHHRFTTGTNEYILKKRLEEPKIVPRISIRSKAFLFDIEDGAFDWKLGTIYRIGLLEQKQRMAREAAFEAKCKSLESRDHRASSRYRTMPGSTHLKLGRGRSKQSLPQENRGRSRSTGSQSRPQSESPPSGRRRRMHYNPDGKCKLTQDAKLSIAQARDRLDRHNAQSWRRRIDGAYRSQNLGMRKIRGIFWGHDEVPEDEDAAEKILAMPERPGLMSTLISDLHIVIDKPSFPIKDYPRFLHRVGKGMPFDMEYSLLIPLSIQVEMGEARVTLRDYPLPLLHVPAIKPGQSPKLSSWSLKTDFVIAEEYRGDASTRQVKVEVVPPSKFTEAHRGCGFAIDVRRTVSPVKTYSDVDIAINTSAPTSITWGTSYQPAIQDMMMIIEGFTKPQADPSDRTGFWDKIRLVAHSHVNVAWRGDGDVRLQLKGSRDPYVVTGNGAGFVMCWRNNVRWGIHQSDDPKKFMTVDSDDYVLAIPDYSHQARESSIVSGRDDDTSSTTSNKNTTIFKKVIMKLSGNVRWLAGLVFERDLDQGGRSFDLKPHYEVTLRTPEHAKAPQGQVYDAFRGFRSNYIHLSIAVAAPLDREWTTKNVKPSTSYNAVHMTPRFFTHFFDWWSLFSGVMSLPIRQGKLFPGIEKSSKKFGRHLATIKYNLLLSPLFIAHIYKHKDVEDYSEDVVSATGLKLRIDSFMLDLHQRREEFAAQGRGRAKQIKTSGMRINQAQLDFISADIRAVSVSIAGTTAEDVKRATAEDLAAFQQGATDADISRFTIPDNDLTWIDMDDFVEIDWILPSETYPETKILPLAFAPHFTYFRQTDHQGASSDGKSSPFGDEPTHFCVMSQDNDPRQVQCQLIEERLQKLDDQIETHERTLGEQELHVIRDSNRDSSLKERYELLNEQGKRFQSKKRFLRKMLVRLQSAIDEGKPWVSAAGDTAGFDFREDSSDDEEGGAQARTLETAPLEPGPINDFNNRFIIHNAQVKWNNSLRNIILRYVHQVSQRRGFIYYMSQKAVKFIDDIVKEQNKHRRNQQQQGHSGTPSSESPSTALEEGGGEEEKEAGKDDLSFVDMINDLLNDDNRVVEADDPKQASEPQRSNTGNLGEDISKEFTPQNAYHVRLVAPQIQLQSEKNPKSVLLITAKGMQLKVVQIMDKNRITDDVSGLVQRRFSVDMDSVQFFVTSQKTLMQFIHIYSGNRYGAPKNSYWPPWVAFEVNFDFAHDPFGWSRVVQRTSASLRYDKYNTLRLKYNDEVSTGKAGEKHKPENAESRLDHLWVDFPRLRATCDSSQYYTLYLIVLDLLLYSEPLEKVRSERLEKIMLASDFSDLNGASDMVVCLQARIRQLEEIKMHFQIHSKYLDKQGWEDRLAIERDLASCEDELFFMMKAITTSQRKNEDRIQTSQTIPLLQWYLSASDIVWHLMKDKNEPLMEIQLKNATYDRTDNSDGSNHNTLEIERMLGFNLLPHAIYPQMLGPYLESGRTLVEGQDAKMLKVTWHSLEAIAGIPVLDQFEVDLFPLKIQLEREIGQKLFDYIFPGGGDKNGGDKSPFMLKQTMPNGADDSDSDSETLLDVPDTPRLDPNGSSDEQLSTRPASLEMRLRPTMAFPEKTSQISASQKSKHFPFAGGGEAHHLRLFHHSNNTGRQNPSTPSLGRPASILKKSSQESLTISRQSKQGSSTSLSTMSGQQEKHKRFTLTRTNSQATTTGKDKDKPSDDLSQMLSRASNYMTLAYVKIPSVILCLSYKGKGERNIEDVHSFVFRMPVLEYRNKTWSNLDLALRLKKDVIRALISHTGAIIGNKFSHHRPSKQQQSRLRELATSSIVLPNTNNIDNNAGSETSSLQERSLRDQGDGSRDSVFSSSGSQLVRTDSFASSFRQPSLHNGVHSEPHSIPESENEGDDSALKTMRQNFMRRITTETQKLRRRETEGEDTDESSSRKKSSQLLAPLGKKILGSLNQ